MEYSEKLANELKNPIGNLYFKESWIHSELEASAIELLKDKVSIENYISSTLIYHQLTEDILKVLYNFCNLIVKASIYPLKFSEEKIINEEGFIKNVELLKKSIQFKNKTVILKNATKINKIRNNLGHNLIKEYININKKNDEDLRYVLILFKEIFNKFNDTIIWFLNEIDRIKRENYSLQKIIKKYN